MGLFSFMHMKSKKNIAERLRQAEKDLASAREQWHQASSVRKESVAHRKVNNFSKIIEESILTGYHK